MLKYINNFLQDEEGASAIEYGLIAALIAVAIATILGTLGASLRGKFTSVNQEINRTVP